MALVVGVGLGDLTAMILSFLGVGLLLESVAAAFYLLKWLGAAYLFWLGIKMWLSCTDEIEISEKDKKRDFREIFRNAYVTTALNPKSIVFFLAFMPQFIEEEIQKWLKYFDNEINENDDSSRNFRDCKRYF